MSRRTISRICWCLWFCGVTLAGIAAGIKDDSYVWYVAGATLLVGLAGVIPIACDWNNIPTSRNR